MTVAEFIDKLCRLKANDIVVVENMYGEWVDPRIVIQPSSPNVVIIIDAKD